MATTRVRNSKSSCCKNLQILSNAKPLLDLQLSKSLCGRPGFGLSPTGEAVFNKFRSSIAQQVTRSIPAGLLSIGICAFACSAEPSASIQRFTAREMNPGVAGQSSKVMVLGSVHLGQNAELRALVASRKNLRPLLDRLAAFKPDLIAVEALSGRDCDTLMQYAKAVPGAHENYCRNTNAARSATNMSVADATSAVMTILKVWPAAPTAADRRHLAALFLAANDPYSALVQWLRLSKADRRSGDSLDQKLVDELIALNSDANESNLIGSGLAAQLRLDRVYPIDDHSADSIVATLGPAYDTAMHEIWNARNAFLDDYKARAKVKTDSDLVSLFRFVNEPETNRQAVLTDMGAAVKMGPPYYGRNYNGWWETRNLRMAANIRAALAEQPGARALIIVGATHKAYLENYLDLMAEVTVVDSSMFLE